MYCNDLAKMDDNIHMRSTFFPLIDPDTEADMDLIDRSRHDLLNVFFVIGAVVGSIAITAAAVVTDDYAKSVDLWFDIFSMATLLSVYLLRNRIGLNAKAFIFLVIIYLLFIVDLIHFGIISTDQILLVLIPFLSILVFDLRRTILFFVFALASYVTVANLIMNAIIVPITPSENNFEPALWINSAIIYTVVALIITLFLKRYNSALIQALQRQQDQTNRLKVSDEQLKQHLSEKNVMIQEIHHRVKNNLAIVSGLLELQARTITDRSAKLVIQKSINRIMSIAKVHKLLYQSDELDRIPLREYLRELTETILDTMNGDNELVHLQMICDDAHVTVNQGVPVGIIFNELITNSLKYAFQDGLEKGIAIQVGIESTEHHISIEYSDNGPGFHNDPTSASNGLGMTLISSLMDQLDAEYSLDGTRGFNVAFSFRTDTD